MSDVYLIKKETLTAIADAIRRSSPYNPTTMTPEQMPQEIEQGVASGMWDEGFERGYTVGYQKGEEYGYSKGQTEGLEALGELCEVTTMVDSADELYVAIFNRHPTYYLHCTFNHTDLGSINVVVFPNKMESYTVSNLYKEFFINNVRWKASAT